MKQLYSILASIMIGTGSLAAETFHIEKGSVTYSYPASTTVKMSFGSDNTTNTLTILDKVYILDNSTTLWVDNTEIEDNIVTVSYSGSGATVNIAGNIAGYVDAKVDGANVSITQNDKVSDQTCGEITYRLSGTSAEGSFYMSGSYKSAIELNGLQLTNPIGAALDIQNGKRIALKVISGSVNSLEDGASGNQKGCIVCKGHLEFKGSGELTVTGNASHAVYAKEYIEFKNVTVTVPSAVKDGFNCNQYFLMESGNLNITSGDDGIQVSYKDETDREAEDTGAVIIKGGNLNVNISADAAKCIKCEGDMTISGGSLDLTASGDGVWDSGKNKTKASSCLASDADMTIDSGTIKLTATGGGGKGINCDGKLTVNGGELTIRTSGGVVAYVNNKLYTDYTGNTDRIASDMKSSPKGIKADGDVTINGGNINVTTTGRGAEGIESKSILTVNDGTIVVSSTDDAINSSSHLYLKGGDITVVASGNDGLDSNGNLYVQGGHIMAFGARSPECGIDANEEEGYTVIFTGGTLLAVGGNNSTPSPSSGSEQPYVSGSGTVSAGSEITLTDNEGTELATFTVPANYSSGGGGGFPGSGSSVLITCPGLNNGSGYTLKLGNSSKSVTAQQTGSGGGGRPGGRP